MSRTPWSPQALARVCARDPEALNAFFEAYFDRAFGYVCRLVGDRHLAEDLTQVAFLKMHQAIHGLDAGRDPTSWVFAVVANTVRDHWRSRAHRGATRTRTLEGIDPAQRFTAEDDQQARDTAGVLDRALGALSENLRAVILLRDYEDMSYADVATALGISEAAARKRHSRGLLELKQAMDGTDSMTPARREP